MKLISTGILVSSPTPKASTYTGWNGLFRFEGGDRIITSISINRLFIMSAHFVAISSITLLSKLYFSCCRVYCITRIKKRISF